MPKQLKELHIKIVADEMSAGPKRDAKPLCARRCVNCPSSRAPLVFHRGELEESPIRARRLRALREHLAELQLPQIAHGRRAIILFEGPEGAGKKYALKQLAAAFDPCHFAVHSRRLRPARGI